MATLTLTAVWINLLSTGAAVSGQRAGGEERVADMVGDTETYGNGRQRGVSRLGVKGSLPVGLRGVTTATVTTLESWVGQTVQYRDNRGRKLFGVFYSVTTKPWEESVDQYDVSLTLKIVTVTEGV